MFDETYEDQFATPMERRYARILRAYRWPLKGFLRQVRYILLELRWRLGDEIMAIPIVEDLVKAYPHDEVALWCSHPEVFAHIHKLTLVQQPPKEVDRYILLRSASRRQKRYVEMAQRVGVPTPERGPEIPLPPCEPELEARLKCWTRPVVALAPGTTWSNKHWPETYWRQLAGYLMAQGITTVEVGSNHEPLGLGLDWVGKTSVMELAQLLNHVDALITLDSGAMHLALSVGTTTVALFGPTAPDYYVQPVDHFYPIESSDPCSGFWNRDQAIPEAGTCPSGHASCLSSIPPQEVYDQVMVALT